MARMIAAVSICRTGSIPGLLDAERFVAPTTFPCMRIAKLALVFMVLRVTRADEWPAPVTREVFSRSRAYFVRVLPGKSFGDTVGFGGAAKRPYATAEFYRL